MKTLKQNYRNILDDFIGCLKYKTKEDNINQDIFNLENKLSEKWKEFEKNIKDCDKCGLCQRRNNVVPGCGNKNAELMIIGEAPGENEDLQGLPFVGRAGELLTEMLKAISINREDVYITNVVKCRPPNNRGPFPDEITECMGYLKWQINMVNPYIILALGNYAVKTLTGTKLGITKTHGQLFNFQGKKLMASFHPAALLRNEYYKRPAWEDLQKLEKMLDNRRNK